MIEIEINGQTLEVENGERLITICDNQGIEVPRFCYHKDLSIAANCRMCLVEIEGNPKPQPACSTSVYAGMKVCTDNQKVKDSQQAVMEFLLINHPLDCPICDQGGECELQDVAMDYGSGASFFSEGKRAVVDNDIGSLISTELTRCIHCTRCVRFGDEVAGLSEFGMLGRGEDMSISTFLESGVDSELSGNMIDICPVGALTSKPFKFSIRSWQMSNHPSIARHDLLGSNLNIQSFDDKVYRISAKENKEVNGSWISDRDRFSYTSLENNRILQPKIKVEEVWQEVGWDIALDFAIKGLKASVITNNQRDKLSSLVSSTASLEELYLLKKLTNEIGSKSTEYRLDLSDLSNYTYLDSTIKTSQIKDFKNIIIIGDNPRYSEPMINYHIRRASLSGANISAYITKESEFNYSASINIVQANEFEDIIQNLDTTDSLIMLGSQIHLTDNISKINYLLKEKHCDILNISTSGNTIAARKVGFTQEKIESMYNQNAYMLFDLGANDITQKLQASIKNAEFNIALNSFNNDFVNEIADVVLPLAGLYETSGTFINIDEIAQPFRASVTPAGGSKPGWKVIKVLADLLGVKDFDFASIDEVSRRALNLHKIIDEVVVKGEGVSEQNQEIIIKNCYQVDEFVRNSLPLQHTKIAKLGEQNVE